MQYQRSLDNPLRLFAVGLYALANEERKQVALMFVVVRVQLRAIDVRLFGSWFTGPA